MRSALINQSNGFNQFAIRRVLQQVSPGARLYGTINIFFTFMRCENNEPWLPRFLLHACGSSTKPEISRLITLLDRPMTDEMAYFDRWSSVAAAFARKAVSYSSGSSLAKTVGRNSATVGWMCMARCTTVQGAFAYMMSSKT